MPDDPKAVIPAHLPTEVAGTPRLPWSRKVAALLIALLADAPPLCLLSESFSVIVDVAVAAVLWLVLGRNWLLAAALVIECIPGVGLAPTWTAYVLFQIIFAKDKTGQVKAVK